MRDFDFFEQLQHHLSGLPEYSRLQRYKSSAITSPAVPDRGALYTAYLDTLLNLLEIPHNLASPHKELYSLYHLIHKVDPYYFTNEMLSDALSQCYSLSLHQRNLLLKYLVAFFEVLGQSKFCNTGNFQLSDEDWEKWHSALPERNAWKIAGMLQDQGAGIAASRSGYRAWHRYKNGTVPKNINDSTPWQQLCENWAETIDESPIYADLLAQAFSGELSHLGIQGYCGETPACTRCPLQTTCLWNNGTVQGSEEEPLQVVIQKEKMDELSTATLAAWLFDLSPEDSEILQSQLSDPKIGSANPLRVLELKTVSELGQILPKVKGFGEKLKALLELSKRYNEERLVPGDLFSCSRDIFQHFRFQLRDLKQEVFILVLLDNKHQYLSEKEITKGILNRSLVHPREVFSEAIKSRAAAIVCVHNHPSGDPKASEDDIQITRRLLEVGKIVGIPLLDHIIVGNDRHFSLADEGLL